MTSNVNYKGGLRTVCEHIKSASVVETDAPIDNNGNGERFSPSDLVATALASCMITVMGIKANQSGVAFDTVNGEVHKIMAADPRRISEIQIMIIVQETWTDKEKTIMENTAKTCPVAKSLHPDLVQNIKFIYAK
jgi:putative redox protein